MVMMRVGRDMGADSRAEGDEAELVRLRTENRLMRQALKMIEEKGPERLYGGGSWAAGVAEQCFVQLGWIKEGRRKANDRITGRSGAR